MHIVAGISPGYICKKRKSYDDPRRNHRDRAVLLGTRSRQEGAACRTRHTILELLQGTQEISARGRAQCGGGVRRSVHPSSGHASRPSDAAVKADGREDDPGGCRSGRGELPDDRVADGLRYGDAHIGEHDVLPSAGTDIGGQCSAVTTATGIGSTTIQ